jgi:rSAM/selenodomain-associated transferase 1
VSARRGAPAALLVIAKAPVPGRSKTRLCPPLSLEEAALLAEAALADTLHAVASVEARRRVLALDGEPGDWLPPGFEVLPQRGEGLAARLGNAFADVGQPALLVGMDTPQLTPGVLRAGLGRLAAPGVDAVLGPARDGGYWAIGLQDPDPAVFAGVPMSTPHTGAAQRTRLRELGRRVVDLPPLRDVDTYDDARAVATLAPRTRFAAALAALEEQAA